MQRYIEILNRRKWVIILTTIAACIVAGVGIYMMPRTYSASATVRVAQAYSGSTGDVDVRYADRLANTYVVILRSHPLLEEAIQRLELNMAPKDLSQKVRVKSVVATELITISAEDTSPWLARDIANTLAELIVEQAQSLYSGGSKSAREILQEQLEVAEGNLKEDRADLESLLASDASAQGEIDTLSKKIALEEETYATLLKQYEQARVSEAMRANSITIVEPAIAPETPSGPRRVLVILVGAMVGLMGGAALALLFENLDTTIYTLEQLRAITGLPLLGKIPRGSGDQGKAAVYASGSPQEEACRLLRTNILSHSHSAPLKTLLITSPGRREGKTTIAANLAHATARAGRKVVAVDGDLRLPALHEAFELPNEAGLSSVLERRASLEEALQTTKSPGLRVLTSGPPPSNPTELLESSEMASLLRQLAEDSDLVLLDSSPLLAAADAVVLAALAEGVAVVAELGETKREAIEAALNQLADVKANPIGIIVTGIKQETQYCF